MGNSLVGRCRLFTIDAILQFKLVKIEQPLLRLYTNSVPVPVLVSVKYWKWVYWQIFKFECFFNHPTM